MKLSKYVPEPLAQRYSMIKQIDILNDLLDAWRNSDIEDTVADQANRRVLQSRIATLKSKLDGDCLSEQLLRALIDDPADYVAWTIATFHYIYGYTWKEISDLLILPERLVKAWCYQAMKKAYRSSRKKA